MTHIVLFSVVGYSDLTAGSQPWTPLNVNVLENLLTDRPDFQTVVDGLRNGFPLGITNTRQYTPSFTRPSPPTALLQQKIDGEVALGRILGPFDCPPLQGLTLSPVRVIPKPGSSKTRLIFNLSHPPTNSVNGLIHDDAKCVSYCSVTDVAAHIQRVCGPSAYLAKVDLADAYRFVPVAKTDWQFLGMRVGTNFYVDRMLPMGAASSCKIFQRVSDAIAAAFLAYHQGPVRVFNYLDDFLFVAGTHADCESALTAFESLCASADIPLAAHKTVRSTTCLTFLGIGLDTIHMSLFLPEEKATKYHYELTAFLRKKRPKVREWQKMAGRLAHAAQVIPSGRVFIGSTYSRLSGVLAQHQSKRRGISAEVHEDLNVWLVFLESVTVRRHFSLLSPGKSSIPPIYTDASSSVGYGGVCGQQWFAGRWPAGKFTHRNIAFLELYAVLVALQLWVPRDADMTVRVYTDNQALVPVLNKLSSRDATLRRLLRRIALLCLDRNCLLFVTHVAGAANIGPDLLSRGLLPEFCQRFPDCAGGRAQVPPQVRVDCLCS